MTLTTPTLVKLRKIPPDELRQILEWIGAGLAASELMVKHGLALTTAQAAWHEYGAGPIRRKRPGRYPRTSDEVRAAIVRDYQLGRRIASIAREHGVEKTLVHHLRRAAGVPLRYPKKAWRRGARHRETVLSK